MATHTTSRPGPVAPRSPERREIAPGQVIVGIDTHKDAHVAVAIDHLGRRLGTLSFANTLAGFDELIAWVSALGAPAIVGIEGAGSYGVRLARWLRALGVPTREVGRPPRLARRAGKSDPRDAEIAARAVAAGTALGTPKHADGPVEAIRVLRIARRSAMKARVQARNQLQGLVATAPEPLHGRLARLGAQGMVEASARLRPGAGSSDPAILATTIALRALARRALSLEAEIADLDAELARLVAARAPGLVALQGIGTDTAGALLVAAGDNPDRLCSESSFAALCGASPLDASSGMQRRHRLNRGGDRLANSALWRIVMVRMSYDTRTRAYVARRTAEGRTVAEIIRCLKRYVAREVYRVLVPALEEGVAPG